MSDNLEDDVKKRIQDQINGKGIFVSKSWRFTSFSDLWEQIFGKKKSDTEENENGGHKTDS